MENARILIVDDETANIRLLELALAKGNYRNILSTADSRQASALFKTFNPDLVLLDLNMPYLDGFQVLEELKKLIPSGVCLPVLVLTADGTVETKRRALAAGASDFLSKPLDYTEVMLRIRNLLETRFLHLEIDRLREKLRQRATNTDPQLSPSFVTR